MTKENPAFRARFRIPQAAAYLGISPKSLADRGWRLRNGIPCSRIGRAVVFDPNQLDAWLARHRERPLRSYRSADDGEGGGR